MIADLDRRALAAVGFAHAVSGQPVTRPMLMAAPGLRLVGNRSGLQVVCGVVQADAGANGPLAALAAWADGASTAFERPPALAAMPRTRIDCTVRDPQGHFLPRAFTLTLPRRTPGVDDLPPAPPITADDNALLPQIVSLWPAAAAPLPPAWAVLRLAVQQEGSDPPRGLGGVLIEASSGVAGKPLRHAMTDANGEALLAFPDIGPVLAAAAAPPPDPPDPADAADAADGAQVPALVSVFDAAITLVFDTGAVQLQPRTDAERAAAATAAPADPDAIVARRAALRQQVLTPTRMAAASSRRRVVQVTWP